MVFFNLTHGLHREDQPEARAAAATHLGQAHFAASGPVGKTCRECTRWQFVRQWKANGGPPKASPCAKYRELMQAWGKNVPHDAWACKYFVERDAAVALVRPEKGAWT